MRHRDRGGAIMTMGTLCNAILVVVMAGCGGVQDVNEGQTSQAISGCDVDTPDGTVLTCSTLPCTANATRLTRHGTSRPARL
jgi:hypothetical protein